MTLLLTLLFKSLLVFAAAGLLLLTLRRSSAAARHLVCLLTLGAVLALPLCSLTLPGWHLPVLTVKQSMEEPTPHQEPTPPRPSAPLPKREGQEFQTIPLSTEAKTLRPPVAGGPLRSEERTKQGGGFLTQSGGFLALYLLGLLLASARPLLGLWGIHRLSRVCTSAGDEPTLTTAAGCAQTLGLQPPRLCRADVPVPMTWGWRHPVVVLPLASVAWPDDRLRSVLLHEIAHVKRRDWPGHRLADFTCAVYWFHPLVWLTARRLRSESELACDDLVLASGVPAPDYARHLLEIASALPRAAGRSHTAIAMAQTSQIESRLHMILDKTRTRRTVARRVLLAALIPGTAALVTLAVLRPDAKAQPFSQPVPLSLLGSSAIQVAGIMDATLPGNLGWDRVGNQLTTAPFDWGHHAQGIAIINKPGQRSLFIILRMPSSLQKSNPTVEIGGTVLGFTMVSPKQKMTSEMMTFHFNSDPQMLVYGVAFPASLSRTRIRVGVPSGPWTRMAAVRDAPNLFLKGVSRTGRRIDFSLPHGKTRDTCDFRAVAVGAEGNEMILSGLNVKTIGSREVVSLTVPAASPRFRSLRIESRPCTWQVFNDVSLRPMTSAQPAAVPPSPAPADFQKTYASGITLSVDALTRLPAEGGQWWRPDGALLAGPIAGREAGVNLTGWSPDQHPRVMLFTATAPHDMNYSEAVQFFVGGKPLEPLSGLDFTQQIQNGRPSQSSRNEGFPEGATNCNLRYGIAAGPWETVAVQKVHFTPASLSPVNASSEKDYNGNVELILSKQSKVSYKDAGGALHLQPFTSQPLGDVARQIVAVDAKGVQIPLFVTGSTGRDMSIIALSFSSHSVLHNYNPKVNLAEVRELRLQTRPYEWKEFDNIALKPVQ